MNDTQFVSIILCLQQQPYSWLTIAPHVLWCAILLVMLVWQLLRWTPKSIEHVKLFPYLTALLAFSYIPLIILSLIALCTNAILYAICMCLLLIVSLTSHVPYWKRRWQRSDNNRQQSTTLRVMTLNCRYGRVSAKQLITTVQKYRIDVLLLQEVNAELLQQLVANGMTSELKHFQKGAQSNNDNGGCNAVFTRMTPITRFSSSIEIDAAAIPSVQCHINIPAKSAAEDSATIMLNVFSVHPKSPMRGTRAWSTGIRLLTQLRDFNSLSSGVSLTIIGGDFNATIDHPAFRSLLHYGFHDTAFEIGKRLHTWPTWLIYPNLTLDHLLTHSRNCQVRVYSQHTIKLLGSDHYAYIAELAVRLQSSRKRER